MVLRGWKSKDCVCVKILDNRKIRREVFLGKVAFDSISLPYI